MAKYQDKLKCKHRAEVSRWQKRESAKGRHCRRFQENKEHLDIFRRWCLKAGVEFRLLNDGEHWQVKTNGKTYDWWPRTAKLVIDQNWKKGIHVHDYTQLIKIIAENA